MNAKAELKTKFGIGDDDIMLDGTGKYWIVKVQNIPILNLATNQFTFNNVGINAVDYLARIANDSSKDEDIKNLCKALYAYHQAALAVNQQ